MKAASSSVMRRKRVLLGIALPPARASWQRRSQAWRDAMLWQPLVRWRGPPDGSYTAYEYCWYSPGVEQRPLVIQDKYEYILVYSYMAIL